MISGVKNKKNKAQKGKKKKMQLAKDPQQAALAVVVFSVFIIYSLYNVFAYWQSQQVVTEPTTQQSAQTAQDQSKRPPVPEQFKTDKSGDQSNPASAQKNQATPQNVAPPASGIPIIPIILILIVVAGIIFAVTKVLSKKDFNNSSTNKKSGKKKKMELAKDPQQAALAVVVFSVFIIYSLYNVFAYWQSQQVVMQPNAEEAAKMAQNQQKSLESLQNNPQGNQGAPPNIPQDANDIYAQTLNIKGNAPGSSPVVAGNNAKSPHEDDVEIMSSAKTNSKLNNGKKILITVASSGRSNPFLPAGENFGSFSSSMPQYTLLPPPETLGTGSEASTVMGTTISGILYDKYSPSAIINIAGTDYLVKRGDVINGYNVLAINKDQVTVQLGKNVYKAGVGELLTLGATNIPNLNKKFGGNEVLVNVKKKGY